MDEFLLSKIVGAVSVAIFGLDAAVSLYRARRDRHKKAPKYAKAINYFVVAVATLYVLVGRGSHDSLSNVVLVAFLIVGVTELFYHSDVLNEWVKFYGDRSNRNDS